MATTVMIATTRLAGPAWKKGRTHVVWAPGFIRPLGSVTLRVLKEAASDVLVAKP
jgi:hypothetical protein